MYKPNSGQMLRAMVFFSGGASALRYLLERDPNLGVKYQIVGAFTNKANASGITMVNEAGIPLTCLNYREWCCEGKMEPKDWAARGLYFAEVCRLIKNFEADIILLSGFMMIITDPLLSEYQGRILNVHPADLTIVNKDGKRKYTGDKAVALAMAAGQKYTYSTVHIVNQEVDGGPIIALSEPWSVIRGIDPAVQQEQMKWVCDGPAYVKALELIISGQFPLD